MLDLVVRALTLAGADAPEVPSCAMIDAMHPCSRELGYRVIEADGAAAALAVLDGQHVALIFTDIIMPGALDGFALAQKAIERRPGIKILLASGFPEAMVNGDFQRMLASQCGLLRKPYRKETLALALREVLDG